MSTIYVSAGAAEYVGGTITEVNGLDLRADPIEISLGTRNAPGPWESPDIDLTPEINSRTAKKLIDAAVASGTYFIWLRLADAPETSVRRVDGSVTVV